MKLTVPLLCGVSALLTACAAPQTNNMTTEFAKSAKCGIVAFVNEQASMQFIGLMVFVNENMTVTVDNASLERAVEDAVIATLKPTLGDRVARLDVAGRAELRDGLTLALSSPDGVSAVARRISETSKNLRGQAQAQGFDCLIAVSPQEVHNEGHPRKVLGLGFFVGHAAFTYYAGRYSILSLTEDKMVASGRLVQQPDADFFTRTTPDLVWIGPVEVSTFVKDFRTDKRLNDRTVEVFKAQAPQIAPVIAGNIARAFSKAPPR